MKLQLSRTVDTIHTHLPYLLQRPFPSSILSKHVQLVLYPSTTEHPPVIKGRVAYQAAFRLAQWTAPLALSRGLWSGPMQLDILSERMVRMGQQPQDQQLVIKWQIQQSNPDDFHRDMPLEEVPAGWFKFEFDDRGLMDKHIVDSVEELGEKGEEPLPWLLRPTPV